MNHLKVYLPCYNEAENIEELIDDWMNQSDLLFKQGYILNILVINDRSTDETESIIKKKKKECNQIDVLSHLENKGLAGGLNSAIHEFLKDGKSGDMMVLMDGDNTHSPSYILSMLEEQKKGYDCIIASRYCKDSGIIGVPRVRELLSDMARVYYRIVLRVPGIKDYTCGYRLYTYESIRKLVNVYGENPIKEKTFACMMEILYKLHMIGVRFGETAFTLRYDQKKGNSKMSVLSTMKSSLLVAAKLRLENKGESKKNGD